MADVDVTEFQICTKCELTKTIDNFRVRLDNGKRRPICNQCWGNRCKRYNASRDPDHVRAYARAYYKKKIAGCPEYAARRRNAQVAKLYGLSADEYAGLKTRFKNVCGICGASPPLNHNLQVDHCHITGRVRGLLCRSCNLGLGKLGDSVEGVERALAYLKAA
jgi:hypothetical protein